MARRHLKHSKNRFSSSKNGKRSIWFLSTRRERSLLNDFEHFSTNQIISIQSTAIYVRYMLNPLLINNNYIRSTIHHDRQRCNHRAGSCLHCARRKCCPPYYPLVPMAENQQNKFARRPARKVSWTPYFTAKLGNWQKIIKLGLCKISKSKSQSRQSRHRAQFRKCSKSTRPTIEI